MKNKSFFDVYAQEYDLMTNAAQREKKHGQEVKAIIEKFHPGSVLDAGCATGLTSRLFTAEGITVVGLDRSRKMIKLADEKIRGSAYPLSFCYGQFEKIPVKFNASFDLVVCLANSLSGINSTSGLKSSFRNFFSVLKPGGILLIQILNYLVVKEKILIPIKTTISDNLIFIRFAERRGRKYSLYIIRLDTNQQPILMEPFRSEFDNFTETEITRNLKKAGFTSIHKYADLFLNRRFSKKSHDMVIVASKPVQ